MHTFTSHVEFKFVRDGSHKQVASFLGKVIDTKKTTTQRRKDVWNIAESLRERVVPHTCAKNAYTLECKPMEHPWDGREFRGPLAWECTGMLLPADEGTVVLGPGDKLCVMGMEAELEDDGMLSYDKEKILMGKLWDDVGDALGWMQFLTWRKTQFKVRNCYSHIRVAGCLALIKTSRRKDNGMCKGNRRERSLVGALVFDRRPIIIPGNTITMSSVFDLIALPGGKFSVQRMLYCLLCRTHEGSMGWDCATRLVDILCDPASKAVIQCDDAFKNMMHDLSDDEVSTHAYRIVRRYCIRHVVIRNRLWALHMGHCSKRSQSLLGKIPSNLYAGILHMVYHEDWAKKMKDKSYRFDEEKDIDWKNGVVKSTPFGWRSWDTDFY